MKFTAILVSCFMVLLNSCTDTDDRVILQGNYTGTFISSYQSPGSAPRLSSLKLDGKNFESTGENRNPAGGSGTYFINEKGFVNFEDENFWTADFDWNLILNGKFRYQIKADSLILTRYFKPCPECSNLPKLYQYRLKRVD